MRNLTDNVGGWTVTMGRRAAVRPWFGWGARCLGVLSVCWSAAAAPAPTFTASVDRNMVALGESVTLTLSFQGGTPNALPELPSVPGLSFGPPGQSQHTQIINGRVSSALILSYEVSASRVGTYTIPAITVLVEGRPMSSQPVTFTVAKADNRLAQIAFLTLGASRPEFYVGEAAVLDIHLFAQGGTLRQAPQLRGEGITIGTNIPSPVNLQVQTNGAIYSRVAYQVPVTFVKAGEFTLTAGECLLDVRYRRRGMPSDPFSSIFGDFDTETRRLTLTSEPFLVRVLPLPTTNRPPDFTGAVGEYSLAVRASTNQVAVGDPITLTVQIAGRGPFDSLQCNPAAGWSQFRTYPPTSRIETTDPFGLDGVKSFEQVVIPESVEVRELPAVVFSYFDPRARAYRSLSHAALPLAVRPAAVASSQPVVLATPGSPTPQRPEATDIVHIKSRPGLLAQIAPPLVARPSFWCLNALAPLLWLVAVLWRRRRESLAANPRLRRRLAVAREVRDGLVALRQAAAANQAEPFFGTLFRLLQEQIGERLDLPASAIAGDTVETRLIPAGLEPETARLLRELFQLCDQVRYAPLKTPEELGAQIPKLEAALSRLQALEVSHAG